ncbi:unnamed protein product [Coregonus sp. 'balchen']|nr:unnamed protein product [Coregonus sp. 'balchen']
MKHKLLLSRPFFQSSRFLGWHSYWVILQDGVLSWYSKQWLDAVEEYCAYSTHYRSQVQCSEEDEEEVMSVGELTESLQSAEACHQKLEKEVA